MLEAGKLQNSLLYASPQLTVADVYLADTQLPSHILDTQNDGSGKIEEPDGDAELKNGILSERHAQSTFKSVLTGHTRAQIPF